MIKRMLIVIATMFALSAHSETIRDVIARNTAAHIASMSVADSTMYPNIVDAYQRVTSTIDPRYNLSIVVIKSPASVAITIGTVMYIGVDHEQLDELMRLIIIAHEAGHAVANDSTRVHKLWETYAVGEVTTENVHVAIGMIQRDLSKLSHSQEYGADAFALRSLVALGWSQQQVVDRYRQLDYIGPRASHPSTYQRADRLATININE